MCGGVCARGGKGKECREDGKFLGVDLKQHDFRGEVPENSDY